jgi:hypothetical protein
VFERYGGKGYDELEPAVELAPNLWPEDDPSGSGSARRGEARVLFDLSPAAARAAAMSS